MLREEFAFLFQTFSRNDPPGKAPPSRGRSVLKKGKKKEKEKEKNKMPFACRSIGLCVILVQSSVKRLVEPAVREQLLKKNPLPPVNTILMLNFDEFSIL